jgi:hypothetical protein
MSFTQVRAPAQSIDPEPEPDEIRHQVDLICGSRTFENARQLRSILKFLVEHDFSDRKRDLSARCIRDRVMDPGHISDESDPTAAVRVQVGRLRRLLACYYLNEAEDPRLRITIAHRTYRPIYEPLQPTPPPQQIATPETIAQVTPPTKLASQLTLFRRLTIVLTIGSVLKLMVIAYLLADA